MAGMMAPPVVVLRRLPEAMFDMAKFVEVAAWSEVLPETVRAPWAMTFPVVVAPPKIVRPEACAPAPIVEDASAVSPPLNERSVEVALFGKSQSRVTVPFAYVRPPEKVVVAALYTTPLFTASPPVPRLESVSVEVKVEEALERRPFAKLTTVEVETP